MTFLGLFHSAFPSGPSSGSPAGYAHAAILVLSALYSTRGLIPPHVADKTEMHKRDFLSWANKYGPNSVRASLILASVFHAYYVLHLPTRWSSAGRTANLLLCLLTSLGGWLRLRCYKELGRLFTFDMAIRKGHKVIQTGPYQHVRHPSYSAFGLLALSQLLLNSVANPMLLAAPPNVRHAVNIFAVINAFFVVIPFSIRIKKEEEMLVKHFGDEYVKYCRRTYRLVRYIY